MPSNARLYNTYASRVVRAPASSMVSDKQEVWKAIAIGGASSAHFADAFARPEDRFDTANIAKGIPQTFSWVPSPLPRAAARKTHVTLAEWEGYVDRISDGTVFARLRNVRRPGQVETETADIPIEEFSFSDRMRLRHGTIFRWAIGISNEGKTQSRYSQLVVRDLPLWTKRDAIDAEQEGAALSARLRTHIDDSPGGE